MSWLERKKVFNSVGADSCCPDCQVWYSPGVLVPQLEGKGGGEDGEQEHGGLHGDSRRVAGVLQRRDNV